MTSGRTQPSKHLGYHEVLDQLRRPGCAICGLGCGEAQRYLESLCGEFVNDPGVRVRLRESLGFCRAHAHQLDAQAGRLTVSILYDDLLNCLERELQEWGNPRRRSHRKRTDPLPCPACDAVRGQEERSLQVMADFTEDPAMSAARHASAGLCRPHLLGLLRLLAEPARRRVLAEETERIERLHKALAEVKRKSDYRFAAEPWTEEEKAAPRRAVAKLVGEPANGKDPALEQ